VNRPIINDFSNEIKLSERWYAYSKASKVRYVEDITKLHSIRDSNEYIQH